MLSMVVRPADQMTAQPMAFLFGLSGGASGTTDGWAVCFSLSYCRTICRTCDCTNNKNSMRCAECQKVEMQFKVHIVVTVSTWPKLIRIFVRTDATSRTTAIYLLHCEIVHIGVWGIGCVLFVLSSLSMCCVPGPGNASIYGTKRIFFVCISISIHLMTINDGLGLYIYTVVH